MGHVAEHQIAEHDHLHDLGIDEGRQHGRRRQPMGGDQEIMSEAAHRARDHHERDDERVGRRGPDERHHRQQRHHADEVRVEQRGLVGIGAGENARGDGIERVESAAVSESSAAGWKVPGPGRVTTSTPMKPTPIAVQRRQRTHSPRIGPDSAATKNGVEKMIAIASSSCR